MMRLLVRVTVVLLLSSLALAVNEPASAKPHNGNAPARIVTVCELVRWGRQREGTRVRVHAQYFTDLHHGAFLYDPQCPLKRIQLGVVAVDADKDSLKKFDNAIARNDYYVGHKFSVEITGVFKWVNGRTINGELPPDRQINIPPHGVLSLLKVWCFQKPK